MKIFWLAIVALLAAGSLPAAAAAPSTGATRVLRTRQPVKFIAADGSRVAVATTTDMENVCDRIVVWSPRKRSSTSFKTGVCNDASTIDDVWGLALAGKTASWLEAGGGNWIDLGVSSHTLGSKKTKLVSPYASYSLSAYESDEYGPYTFLGNVFGAGNLLVFNSWTACMEVPVGWDGATCPQSAPGSGPVMLYSNQKLLKVVNGKDVEIASAPNTQIAATSPTSVEGPSAAVAVAPAIVAVDAKRIAVQNPDGSVTIYSAKGAVLKSIPVHSGTFSGFALQGSQLVTIRNGRLELYSVSSGKLVKAIKVPDASLLGGLEKGLVTYVGYRIHVLRLSDRKDVTFSSLRSDFVDARIDAAGLFYAYNTSGHAPGRVVFVPYAKVLKKLG
jgi:hypothetical protein